MGEKFFKAKSYDFKQNFSYSFILSCEAWTILLVNDDESLTLTEEGETYAKAVFDRHLTLTKFLISLGVDEKIAEEDACKIEHVISDETLEKIKEHIK